MVRLVLPLVAAENPKPPTFPEVFVVPAKAPVSIALSGDAAARVVVFTRPAGAKKATSWEKAVAQSGPFSPGTQLGFAATVGAGKRDVTIRFGDEILLANVAPALLTSSLDTPEMVFVVDCPLTKSFVKELTALSPVPVRAIPNDPEHGSDIWMQDTVEFAVAPTPAGSTLVPILGVRGKHDMGLTCGPLDANVAKVVAELPGCAPILVGPALPGRRWIDWFGNLEATPAVPSFPYGRILTGKQKDLSLHPDVLAFLKDQAIQWPPLTLDVSWLTIGHVDELINFVPAKNPPGWRVLMPSPTRALKLLDDAIAAGRGDETVFAGHKSQTTVAKLRARVPADETARIEESLAKTRAYLLSETGIGPQLIVDVPVLFENGLATVPNAVNCLVLNKRVIAPDPGWKGFADAIAADLKPLGCDLKFVDVHEPYHARSGEIHCGTNAIRKPKRRDWWHDPVRIPRQ